MLVNTLVGLFCTCISKQPNILGVDHKWSHCLNCFPSASNRVDQIYSDSIAAQISTALLKSVRWYDRLTVDIGYIIHVELVGGSGDVYILMSLSHGSPNLQLGSAAFHLFKSVRNPSSAVVDLAVGARYRIISSFFFYFTTKTRVTSLAKRKRP